MSGRWTASKRRLPELALCIPGLVLLGGCAGLGGHVKGSFDCSAPDGICAPSAVIDDRALAMITDDPSAVTDRKGAGRRTWSSNPGQASIADAAGKGSAIAQARRSGAQALRIVFPAHVDEKGRLHEATAIHAVVDDGQWRQASAESSTAGGALKTAPLAQGLAEALVVADRQEPKVDPHLPHPDTVAAARARAADPIAQIRADVEHRLAPPAGVVRASVDAPGTRKETQPVAARPSGSAASRQDHAAPRAIMTAQPSIAAPGTRQAANFPAAIPEDH